VFRITTDLHSHDSDSDFERSTRWWETDCRCQSNLKAAECENVRPLDFRMEVGDSHNIREVINFESEDSVLTVSSLVVVIHGRSPTSHLLLLVLLVRRQGPREEHWMARPILFYAASVLDVSHLLKQ